MKIYPTDTYSEIYPEKSWKECVDHGIFIPDDGSGYWGTLTEYDRDTNAFDKKPENATHVHWYNR